MRYISRLFRRLFLNWIFEYTRIRDKSYTRETALPCLDNGQRDVALSMTEEQQDLFLRVVFWRDWHAKEGTLRIINCKIK